MNRLDINAQIDFWYQYMHAHDRERLGPCRAHYWSREGQEHCRSLLDKVSEHFGYTHLGAAIADAYPEAESDLNLAWRMSGFSVVLACAYEGECPELVQMVCDLISGDGWRERLTTLQDVTHAAIRSFGGAESGAAPAE